jgi:5-hydroxyisourate hydrolase
LKIELWRLDGAARTLLRTVHTNRDGRTDAPLLGPDEIKVGRYELLFQVGAYFAGQGGFLDEVPVRFDLTDAGASYHVPLLVSPWAYTTYRGS